MKLLMGSHDGTKEKHKLRKVMEALMGMSQAVISDSEDDEGNSDNEEQNQEFVSNDILTLP